jgi:putative radical SAM enzyme (TIGR03279 family)
MSAPRVVSVAAASPAQRAGLQVGDELLAIDGRVPKDVIEYRLLVDEADPELEVKRGHAEMSVVVAKAAGEALGAEVSSALFDRVRTCDNHCEFCFIYQLPKGMRKSLYLKDDDYRLSFLYGNFTTLTRFTELDLERVLTEGLSPLFVSIHSTDPELRARMLRNVRGATSLRWLRALLDGGVEVHGQVVVCPGVNDAEALETTLAGVLDEYPELATVACVPLGVSDYTKEPAMRTHSRDEAAAVIDTVEQWQEIALRALGRRLVYAADEYYLIAGRPFPAAARYDGFPQHENGIGMARAFAAAFAGDAAAAFGVKPGFFAWVDGAPAAGYRAVRAPGPDPAPAPGRDRSPVAVITGEYGAMVLGPLLATLDSVADAAGPTERGEVRLLPVHNAFFGGNIAVTGLLTGVDIARALDRQPVGHRYLLPDVCLSEGRFLDGMTPAELPRSVEIVPTDGLSLRQALEARPEEVVAASSHGSPHGTPVAVALGQSR